MPPLPEDAKLSCPGRAFASATPSALVPGVPTVAGSGVPGYEWVGMTHVMAPAKTPAAIVNQLSAELAKAIAVPDVREKLLALGIEPVGSTPAEFTEHLKNEIARWGPIIAKAGVKVE